MFPREEGWTLSVLAGGQYRGWGTEGGKQGVFRNVSHFDQGHQRPGSRDFREPRTFERRALWEEGVVYDDLEEHSGGNNGGGQPKDKRVEMFTGQWRVEWCRSKNASEGVTFS